MGIVEPDEFDVGEIGMMMTGAPRASASRVPAPHGQSLALRET
jgi:hypothetical protein